jgi:hypothetical protein
MGKSTKSFGGSGLGFDLCRVMQNQAKPTMKMPAADAPTPIAAFIPVLIPVEVSLEATNVAAIVVGLDE